MAKIEFDGSLNVRTISSYFSSIIKTANYDEDMVVTFPDDTNIDLAALQILIAMKKEVEKNGKTFKVQGLEKTIESYLD